MAEESHTRVEMRGNERSKAGGSVHVCEPHTHTIRGPITCWHVYWSSYNMVCVWASHTYYKNFNSRVNAGLAILLYVCVAHTHEPNPKAGAKLQKLINWRSLRVTSTPHQALSYTLRSFIERAVDLNSHKSRLFDNYHDRTSFVFGTRINLFGTYSPLIDSRSGVHVPWWGSVWAFKRSVDLSERRASALIVCT